jgi:hypothetical protein
MISLPTVASATLGQYDEYKRAVSAFSIDADPVSASSFQRCVAAGQCTKPSCAAAHGADGRVTCVDLAQAKSYCAFAGERLPSEEEWEHAARQASALAMHASAIAAGVTYWNGATLEALAALRALRAAGTPAFATIDAGPHVKVLVRPGDAPRVRSVMESVPGVLRVLDARPGEGAALVVPRGEAASAEAKGSAA